MKNFKVWDLKTKCILGDFLNVETVDGFVKVWYYDEGIKSKFREEVELKLYNQ